MQSILKKLFFQLFYLRKPPWDTNQTPPEVYEFLGDNQPGRALDLGCGTGTNVITLAEHGWECIGVDFIPKAIRAARKKARAAGVEVVLRVGDVTRLDGIEGPFNLILDIGCYHSLDPDAMARYRERVEQLIAPGGTYMVYLFFLPEGENPHRSGSHATESDLEPFLDFMELVLRIEGEDRGHRRSTWFTYRKV
jgi:cyclopropane fatty-acyl-phospholipid synthase-like methyltransferase